MFMYFFNVDVVVVHIQNNNPKAHQKSINFNKRSPKLGHLMGNLVTTNIRQYSNLYIMNRWSSIMLSRPLIEPIVMGGFISMNRYSHSRIMRIHAKLQGHTICVNCLLAKKLVDVEGPCPFHGSHKIAYRYQRL